MDSARREWILSGLALADGVGLVSSVDDMLPRVRRPIVQSGERCVLFGDALATGLGVSMMPLARAANVRLYADGRARSTPARWFDQGWFEALLTGQPGPILGAFGWDPVIPTVAMFQLEERALARGTPLIWVAPPAAGIAALQAVEYGLHDRPHRLFRSDGLDIPLGPDNVFPTVRGYAGWAGALWDWLTAV